MLCSVCFIVVGPQPVFDVPLHNVTVVAGGTALLPCTIDHLGKYRVLEENIPFEIKYLSLYSLIM